MVYRSAFSISSPITCSPKAEIKCLILPVTSMRYGFVETKYVVDTIRSLRREFPGFGGVYGWDYFDAGMAEVDGGTEPWQWVQIIKEALYGLLSKRGWIKSYE